MYGWGGWLREGNSYEITALLGAESERCGCGNSELLNGWEEEQLEGMEVGVKE